jgi:hypothetical protein
MIGSAPSRTSSSMRELERTRRCSTPLTS